MPDNIIEFNGKKPESDGALKSVDLSTGDLMGRLASLPENGLMGSVSEAINLRMERLLLLADIGKEVSKLLGSVGFDPDDFLVDDESVDRFLTLDPLYADGAPWNGPLFDWELDETTARVATTVCEPEEDGRVHLMIDLFRLDEGDSHWKRFTDDGWVNDGPPEDLFDFLEEYWDCLDEEEWDRDDWDDEDDEDDDWDEGWEDADDDSLLNLSLNGPVYQALTAAGIETISQLEAMDKEELLTIDGIDRKALFIIKKALS